MKQHSVFFALFIVVLSVLADGKDTNSPQDPDVMRYLRGVTDHVTRLEHRLHDQEVTLVQQEGLRQLQKEEMERQRQDFTTRINRHEQDIQHLQTERIELMSRIHSQDESISQLKREAEKERKEFRAMIYRQKKELKRQFSLLGQQCDGLNNQSNSTSNLNPPSEPQIDQTPSIPTTHHEPLPSNLDGKNYQSHHRRSDDIGALGPVIDQLTQQMTQMTSDIQVLKNTNQRQDQAIGTSYIRWGHVACPSSAELVYTGLIAGTPYNQPGGSGNHLCMTSHPANDAHPVPTGNFHGTIHGSEYDVCPEAACNTTPACAACRISRAATVMIPGTNTCATGWSKEYAGYIMGGYEQYTGSSEYICVDASLSHHESSTSVNHDENIIRYITAKCGALPCPPYVDNKLVVCVVCSK